MTAGYTGTSMAAGDVAWRAWNRLGVSAWDHMFLEAAGPAILDELAAAMAPELDRVSRLVLDELEVRLYGEARERVVAHVKVDMVRHTLWAIVEAVEAELMRPDPIPFAPPPAGAWVRGRGSARAEWRGLWHRFSGDLVASRHRVNEVTGRARCGVWITLRSEYQDAAIAGDMPGVDACRRCARAA
jgi:hypothetical protein